MLDLSDSLIVSSSLCPFVLLVCGGGCAGFIAWSIWVEDPYIEIGRMEVVSKEPIGFHIESCTVLPNGCAVRHFLTTEGLQMWLNGNVVTHLR